MDIIVLRHGSRPPTTRAQHAARSHPLLRAPPPQRINLDNRVAKAAKRAGADLKEGFEVSGATFDKEAGLWTVTSASGERLGFGQGEAGRGGACGARRPGGCRPVQAAALARVACEQRLLGSPQQGSS